MKRIRSSSIQGLTVLAFVLASCANVPLEGTSGQANSNALSGVELLGRTELPAGSRILPDQSLIMGAGDNWVGRVRLDAGQSASEAYAFFLQTLPSKGWSLVSAVRGPRSFLVLNKDERTLSIDITEGNAFANAKIDMTMAPRNAMNYKPQKAK